MWFQVDYEKPSISFSFDNSFVAIGHDYANVSISFLHATSSDRSYRKRFTSATVKIPSLFFEYKKIYKLSISRVSGIHCIKGATYTTLKPGKLSTLHYRQF